MSGKIRYSKDERKYLAALKAAALWIRNPVSEDGAKQLFRIAYSALGPEIHNLAETMKQDPGFRQILEQRRDLGQVLSDMDNLSKLPEGSVGKFYHDFMSGDEIFPGYILGGLAYKDGHFDALADWDDDAKFLVERVGNTHDISHVIAGYGTDFPGESLLIPFTVGASGVPAAITRAYAAGWAAFTAITIKPSIGTRTWVSMIMDAADRGIRMGEHNTILQINYEDLLELPLQEAREKLRVPPHKHQKYVNKDGFLASGQWMQGWFGKQMETGFGTIEKTMENVRKTRTLIESGQSIHDVMSAPRKNVNSAFELISGGADKEVVRSQLLAYSR